MILVKDAQPEADPAKLWTMALQDRTNPAVPAVRVTRRKVTVDLDAMSTMDPAVAAMHEAAGNGATPVKSPVAGPAGAPPEPAAEAGAAPEPGAPATDAQEAAARETIVDGQALDVATETTEERRVRFERDAMQYVDRCTPRPCGWPGIPLMPRTWSRRHTRRRFPRSTSTSRAPT